MSGLGLVNLRLSPSVKSLRLQAGVVYSREGARVAVVDTHVLKLLRGLGVPHVPDSVPSGKAYARLERVMLDLSDASGMTVADFDLKVWSWYADGNRDVPPFAPKFQFAA